MSDYRMGKNVKQAIEDIHKSISPINYLGTEMLEILWSYYLWKNLPSELSSDNTLENLRTWKFCELLVNDIILRLCKFRDADSRSLSFEQVTKELRKHSTTKDHIEGVEPLIKEYKTTTRNIENHRNTYIAHLAKRDRTHLKLPTEIHEAICLAVQIIDQLSGCQNKYDIEGIELRNAVLDNRA